MKLKRKGLAALATAALAPLAVMLGAADLAAGIAIITAAKVGQVAKFLAITYRNIRDAK